MRTRAAKETRAPLDVCAELPLLGGVTSRLDCLVPGVDSWRLHLRVQPRWWKGEKEGHERVPALEITAADDLGGTYTSRPRGRRRGFRDGEQVTLEFRPRLDPRAARLTLRVLGAAEEVKVHLEPAHSG